MELNLVRIKVNGCLSFQYAGNAFVISKSLQVFYSRPTSPRGLYY